MKKLVLRGETKTEIIRLSTKDKVEVNQDEQVFFKVIEPGSYTLHLYVDEDIPKNIIQNYILEDIENTILNKVIFSHGTLILGEGDCNTSDLPCGLYKASIYPLNINKLYENNELNALCEQKVRRRIESVIGKRRYQNAKAKYFGEKSWDAATLGVFGMEIFFVLLSIFLLPLPGIWFAGFVIILCIFFKTFPFHNQKDIEMFSKIHLNEQINHFCHFVGKITKV